MRSFTPVEAAVGVALLGSVLAVAVPAFVRNLSSSRLVEATRGLNRIGEHAIAGAAGKTCANAFPAALAQALAANRPAIIDVVTDIDALAPTAVT